MIKKEFKYDWGSREVTEQLIKKLRDSRKTEGRSNVQDLVETAHIKNDLVKLDLNLKIIFESGFDEAVQLILDRHKELTGVADEEKGEGFEEPTFQSSVGAESETVDTSEIDTTIEEEVRGIEKTIGSEPITPLEDLLGSSDKLLQDSDIGISKAEIRENFQNVEYIIKISQSGKSLKLGWAVNGNTMNLVVPSNFKVSIDHGLFLDLWNKEFGHISPESGKPSKTEFGEQSVSVRGVDKTEKRDIPSLIKGKRGRKRKYPELTKEDLTATYVGELFDKHKDIQKVTVQIQKMLGIQKYKEASQLVTNKLIELSPNESTLEHWGFTKTQRIFKAIIGADQHPE